MKKVGAGEHRSYRLETGCLPKRMGRPREGGAGRYYAARICQYVAKFASLVLIAHLGLAACGSEPEEVEQNQLLTTPVFLPPAPPVCEKDTNSLTVFANYTAPACIVDIAGKKVNTCLQCFGNADCPQGAECKGDAIASHCQPAKCTNDDQCSNGPEAGAAYDKKYCNRESGRCEYLACADDSTCPCGSYCDSTTNRCRLDCLTGTGAAALQLACNGTLSCDTRGRCSSTVLGGGTEIPLAEVVLSAAPEAIDLPAEPSVTLPVTVTLSTTDIAVGTRLPRAVRIVPPPGVQVSCGDVGPLSAAECTIEGAGWSYVLAGGRYTATRTARLIVQPEDEGPTQWTLELATDDDAEHARVRVTKQPPKKKSGRYRGLLTVGSGDPTTAFPIEATVTATRIALHDPSRFIAPTGTVQLPFQGNSQTTSFLGGSKQRNLYNKAQATFNLLPESVVFNDVTGKLTGSLLVRLATSPDRQDSWTFALERTADVTLVAPCPNGEIFDSVVSACIPGERWDAGSNDAPSVLHPTANLWLNAMAPRLSDPLLVATGAEPLAERLLCFDATMPSNNAGFLKSTLPVSGDLQCAGTTGHNWWGVGLTGFQDRGPVSPVLTQVNMLRDCLQQLTTPVPTTILENNGVPAIENSTCVSLPRLMPALFALAGSVPYRSHPLSGGSAYDGRSRLLFLRLLQQWTQLIGFVARNGTEQRGVADLISQLSSPTDPEKSVRDATQGASFGSLLDVVDDAWTLVLDRRVHGPLRAIAPQVIANPDYRMLNRPLAYWTFSSLSGATVVNAIQGAKSLLAQSCTIAGGWLMGSASCAPQAAVPGLGGNITLAFKLIPNLTPGGTSTIIDSDGLTVRLVHPSSPSTPFLEVSHLTSDGTSESRILPLAGGFNTTIANYFVLTRDVVQGYSLWHGPVGVPSAVVNSENVHVAQVATQEFAEPVSDEVRIGASRTAPTDNLKGKLSEVAIWNSALSETEATTLIANYADPAGGPKPAWPSEVTLPAALNPDANETRVGLPVMLLESEIATQRLIDAYVQDAVTTNLVACRSGHSDDSLLRSKERAGRSLRLSYTIQQLAESLHASATQVGGVEWAARYDQALTELRGARAKTVQTLAGAGTCENPIGLAPTEFPLYFGDTRSLFDSGRPLDLLEASALFLKREAGSIGGSPAGAIGDAAIALADARGAWTQQYSSAVQDQVTNDQTRLDDIRSSFGRELVDLCGVSVAGSQEAATVLARFLNATDPNGHLSPQDCYVQTERQNCTGSEQKPLAQVDPACLRGQMGEAWLATRSAAERVKRAQLAWETARGTRNGWLTHCASKQRALGLQDAIVDRLRDLETAEAKESEYLGFLRGGADVVVGYRTGNPQEAIGGIAGIVNSIKGLVGGVADKKAAEQAFLQAVVRNEVMAECWFQADLAGQPIGVAEQDITNAAADLQTSLSHVTTLQNHLSSTVLEAGAAIAREEGRLRPRVAFHYWAQEKLEVYQRRMARARRMTYLYLRAVEHDLQRNFQLDDDVMGAVHPEQLNHVALQLNGFLANGIEKRVPERRHTVLSLCKDVLRLPEHNNETDCDKPKSAQRFRELLFSPSNAMYKEDGAYLGQAIPFTLTPDLASLGQPSVFSRCVERLAEVDVNFVNDSATNMPVLLAKRETFYSDTCSDHVAQIGPFQEGTLRSSSNLLVEGGAAHFGQDFEWARADITALPFDQQRFVDFDSVGPNAVRALGGRGMYGNYALIVPPATLTGLVANPGSLRDFKIRFDYVSVPDLGVAAPTGTNQLVISYLDGENRPLTNLAGNLVTASCASNCQPDSISNLTATAASGWHFGGWSGACSGSATTCSVAMSSSRQVWATFIDDRAFDLTLDRAGNGSGSVTSGWMGAGTGPVESIAYLPFSQALPANVLVILTATAAPGSRFTGWSGACTGTSSVCIILATDAIGTKTVRATFDLIPHSSILTITRTGAWESWNRLHGYAASLLWEGGETGREIPCHDYVCKIEVPNAQTLNLSWRYSMLPGDKQDLLKVTGADCESGAAAPGQPDACNVYMLVNRSVVFGHSPWSILDVAPPTHGRLFTSDGRISCGPSMFDPVDRCSLTVESGSSVLLFESPASGYQFAGWSVAGCGNTAGCSVLVNAPYGHVAAAASFSLLPPPPTFCTPGATRPCCSCGGRCNCMGEQVCKVDGSAWGSCTGSVCAPSTCQ